MGRIVVSENISLDGVIQDPTGDEGFAFGGWFDEMSAVDREDWAKVEFKEALATEAWLVGRGSYAWFATRWADRPGEWADRLREIPKYVVSSTLDEATEWAHSTVLKGNVANEVETLKRDVDGDILVYASAPLVATLMGSDLVDELRLMVHPFVLGAGTRLFPPLTSRTLWQLADVRTVGDSLAMLTYRRQADV